MMNCEYESDLIDEMIFGSSLPFARLIVLCVVLLFCDDHQIIDVSRSERFSRSTGEQWLRFIAHLGWSWCFISFVGLLLGSRPMYSVWLVISSIPFNFYIWFILWHRGVPYVVRSGFKLQDCAIILFQCDASLITLLIKWGATNGSIIIIVRHTF